MTDRITLAHGAGGALTRKLMRQVFLRHLHNPELSALGDSAPLNITSDRIAFTTDNFVVDPIFFPGGDLGKLAVCGTVNDLAVSGAEPKYISAGLIIEEGYPLDNLEKLVISMANASFESGVKVVCADVKVVERGKADGVFINTSGLGVDTEKISSEPVNPGDIVIISGTVGDHEIAVINARIDFHIKTSIVSDCAPLTPLIRTLLDQVQGIKMMRDPTQGGIATLLCKWVESSAYGIKIREKDIPIAPNIRSVCQILGLDPLYLANQGKAALICRPSDAQRIIDIMHKNPLSRDAAIIGKVWDDFPGKVILQTETEGEKILEMRAGEGSYRVC